MVNTFSSMSFTYSDYEWQDGGWDDSTQTPEEIQAKLQFKQEAALKRERALAYAFSHQVCVPLHRSVYVVSSMVYCNTQIACHRVN